MSEQAQQVLTPEQRIEVLEHQSYVLYVQVNALSKLLVDNGIFTAEVLAKTMDELNDEIYKFTNEQQAQAQQPPAEPAEQPAE